MRHNLLSNPRHPLLAEVDPFSLCSTPIVLTQSPFLWRDFVCQTASSILKYERIQNPPHAVSQQRCNQSTSEQSGSCYISQTVVDCTTCAIVTRVDYLRPKLLTIRVNIGVSNFLLFSTRTPSTCSQSEAVTVITQFHFHLLFTSPNVCILHHRPYVYLCCWEHHPQWQRRSECRPS